MFLERLKERTLLGVVSTGSLRSIKTRTTFYRGSVKVEKIAHSRPVGIGHFRGSKVKDPSEFCSTSRCLVIFTVVFSRDPPWEQAPNDEDKNFLWSPKWPGLVTTTQKDYIDMGEGRGKNIFLAPWTGPNAARRWPKGNGLLKISTPLHSNHALYSPKQGPSHRVVNQRGGRGVGGI